MKVMERCKRNSACAVDDVFSLHITVKPLFRFRNLREIMCRKNLVKAKLYHINLLTDVNIETL